MDSDRMNSPPGHETMRQYSFRHLASPKKKKSCSVASLISYLIIILKTGMTIFVITLNAGTANFWQTDFISKVIEL